MKERVYFEDGLFREGAEGAALIGCRCVKCGKVFFPKTDFCSSCLGSEFEEKLLSREGVIYSYTVTRVPVAKFPVPHAIGMISIPEDSVRVVAPLVYDENRQFSIGDKVELVADTLWEDENTVVGYKFRLKEAVKA